MDGTEGSPDGTQPAANDNPEPMPPADAGPMNVDSAEGTTPTPDSSVDPNQSPELNPDGTPREPERPKTLREQAIAAFSQKNDFDGQHLLWAHFVAAPDAPGELAKKMSWFPGLMRPALGPRIGMAVLYSETSREFRGNPMPIGSAELTSAVEQIQQNTGGDQGGGGTRRSRQRNGGEPAGGNASSSGDADAIATAGALEQLRFYTGEFGEILLETLQERTRGGQYGAMAKELLQESSRKRGESDDPNNPGNSLSTPEIGLAPEPNEGANAGSARARRRATRPAGQDSKAAAEPAKQLSPGILWLGKFDEREQVTKRAEAAAVDVLAIFEINVRESRTGNIANNTTRLRLLSVKPSFPAVAGHTPEALVNLTVEQWRQKEQKGTDPVDREIDKAVEAFDKLFKPTALPEALTAERAKKRIADLVAVTPAEPLPVLVEARFYATKGLISQEEFEGAAIALLGQNGYAELKEKAKVGTE